MPNHVPTYTCEYYDACAETCHAQTFGVIPFPNIYIMVSKHKLRRCNFRAHVHVLLDLLNELIKIDRILGLLSILSHFRFEFHKFNNTGVRILDSVYHMTLRLLKNRIFV